jgi:hypothetical protein
MPWQIELSVHADIVPCKDIIIVFHIIYFEQVEQWHNLFPICFPSMLLQAPLSIPTLTFPLAAAEHDDATVFSAVI